MGDLARASKGRAVFVAPDEQAMRGVVDAARWFAPELQVIEFPAWDCLPYDRASPALSVSSRRLSASSHSSTSAGAWRLAGSSRPAGWYWPRP